MGTLPDRSTSGKRADQTARRYARLLPEERRADRRQRVVLAAVDAFAERGYLGVSIEQLCSAAKVSTRGFYEEFDSKEDVLGSIHDELNDRALAAVVAALADAAEHDVRARAAAGCAAYFSVMTEDRRWAKVVLVDAVGVSPAMEGRRQAAVDRFADLLAAEAGRLRAAGALPDRSYRVTAVALVGAIKELAVSWASGSLRGTEVESLAAEAAALVVAALSGR